MFGLYATAGSRPTAINSPKRKKGRKKSRGRKKGGAFARFRSCYYMTHKGRGLRAKTIAAAWKRHQSKVKKLKHKFRPKLTKIQRKVITKLARSGKKLGMTQSKYGKLLAQQTDWEVGGIGRPLTTGQKKKIHTFEKRIASLAKARVASRHKRLTKKGESLAKELGYGSSSTFHFGGMSPVRLNRKKKGRKYNMAKRKHGYRKLLAMNPPAMGGGAMSGTLSGFNLSNITGLVPILGGAIANGIIKGIVQPRLPSMFQRGIGGIASSIVSSGLVGGLGYAFFGPRIGAAMLKGGLIETGAQAFLTARDQGFGVAFGMSGVDYGHWLESTGMSGCPGCAMGFPPRPGTTMPYGPFSPGMPPGMRDYADPRQINNAMNTDGMHTAQYPLPQPGVVPMTTMNPHHHAAAVAAGASPAAMPSQVSPAAEHEAVSAVMSDLGSDFF